MDNPEGLELSEPCTKCGGSLFATVDHACHDPAVLDLVVECKDCGAILNEFVTLADMLELND